MWLALAAAVVLVVVLLVSHHHAQRHRTATPGPSTPGPSIAATASAVPMPGSVFLEPLGTCTKTDHLTTLRIAFAITNLGAAPLEVEGAAPLVADASLRLVRVVAGAPPCAASATTPAAVIRSGRGVVIALSYRLGPGCPQPQVAVRVRFLVGGRPVHVDSSTLVDSRTLGIVGC